MELYHAKGTSRRVSGNFIGHAMTKGRPRSAEEARRIYDECAMRFWTSVTPFIYIAHEEMLKTEDLIEETPVAKSMYWVNNYIRRAEKLYDSYVRRCEHILEGKDRLALWQDFQNNVYKEAEHDIYILFIQVSNLLANKHVPMHDTVAQGVTAFIMLKLATHMYGEFFGNYKRISGIDFRPDFREADMAPVLKFWTQAMAALTPTNDEIVNFADDSNVAMAYNALLNRMEGERFLDDAGRTAIMLNKKFAPLLEDCE